MALGCSHGAAQNEREGLTAPDTQDYIDTTAMTTYDNTITITMTADDHSITDAMGRQRNDHY